MGSYVNPLPNGAVKKRSDAGRDYQGKPGDPVVAIGRARVDAVKDDPHGFGKAIYYTLLDGPHKGQQIYVGHAGPTVKNGQIVKAGQTVAILQQHGLGSAYNDPGWVEMGLAKGGIPQFQGQSGGAKPFENIISGAPTVQPTGSSTAATTTTTTDTAPPTSTTPEEDQQVQDNIAAIPQEPSATPPTYEPPQAGEGVDTSLAPQGAGSSASLWQTIMANGQVSPETQYLAQLSQSGG